MARKKKTHTRRKSVYYVKSRHLAELSAFNKQKMMNTGYAAIGGVAAKFLDNVLNFDPKIKGVGFILGSLIVPDEFEAMGHALAGKGGELLAQSLGVLSDKEIDGVALLSEEEINEIADEIADELESELAEELEENLAEALSKGEENLAQAINEYAI